MELPSLLYQPPFPNAKHLNWHNMFSNNQNIETIGQLVETLKHYIGLQKEYVQLSAVEKTVKVLTTVGITAIVCLLLMFILTFLSFAMAFAMCPIVGEVAAFAIVAGVYLVVLLLVLIFRKQWIEKPLVHFLAELLLS